MNLDFVLSLQKDVPWYAEQPKNVLHNNALQSMIVRLGPNNDLSVSMQGNKDVNDTLTSQRYVNATLYVCVRPYARAEGSYFTFWMIR